MQNITISINQYITELTLNLVKEKQVVGFQNVQKFTFTNKGNSTLREITLSLQTNSDFKDDIYANPMDLLLLRPGESFTVQLELWNYIYKDLTANISILVKAERVDETGKGFTQIYTEKFPVYRINEQNFFNMVIIGLFVVGVAVIWFASIRYMLKKYHGS